MDKLENMNVRMGQKEDMHSVMMLVKDHLEEVRVLKTESVLLYCLTLLSRAIENDLAIIGVIGPIGDVQGYIALDILEDQPSRDSILVESGIYVKKELRKSKNKYQDKFIDFAKKTAIGLGLKLRLTVNLNRPRKEAYLRFLRKKFGEPTHITYTFDPLLV